MRISYLRLHDFRNYRDTQLYLEEGIHIFAGNNAQGKTNLLEAVLYLSTTRSHRSSSDQDLIRENCEAFFIRAQIEKEHKKEELRAAVNQKGKNLFIYQNPVGKVSDFIGELNAVMFCPDDMNLFQASPRVRRRFIDMELSKISRKYVLMLSTAQKLLKERNAYMKQPSVDRKLLAVLTERLIEVQVVIMRQRNHFLKQLLQACQQFYARLSDDATTLDIVYESCVPYRDEEESLRASLSARYEKTIERDILLGQTTIGIHKEDFLFRLNGKELEAYASQGQKRSVLLSLKIGMVHMIRQITKEYPILLLDDVFSELDEKRRRLLLLSLPQEVQIFISTTDRKEAEQIQNQRKVTLWKVCDGSIVKE